MIFFIQINSQCQYPCKCSSSRDHNCKAGVNVIKDGCDCCYMCARQQGDLCDYKDRCDEDKGLYCDFHHGDGVRGICRGKTNIDIILVRFICNNFSCIKSVTVVDKR